MALGAPYATVPDLRERFGIDDTIDDTHIDRALKAASKSVTKWCRRQFNDAGTATPRVFLPDTAVRAEVDDLHTAAGLIVATDDTAAGTYGTVWDEADFQLEPFGGIVDGEPGWPFDTIRAVGTRRFPCHGPRASVKVTARWGWAQVPEPVADATLQLAAELFKLKDAPFGVAGFGEFGAIRVRDNPKVKALLTPYRRDPVLVG